MAACLFFELAREIVEIHPPLKTWGKHAEKLRKLPAGSLERHRLIKSLSLPPKEEQHLHLLLEHGYLVATLDPAFPNTPWQSLPDPIKRNLRQLVPNYAFFSDPDIPHFNSLIPSLIFDPSYYSRSLKYDFFSSFEIRPSKI